MNSLVSIIIPTFNRAHLIGETLDSVLAQTYKNWECIVVDDGSTDNTDVVLANYIRNDNRFQYHHRPKNRLPGGNAARNYGFEKSKGEYVQWFDSDDLMEVELIQKQLSSIKNNKVKISICLLDRYNSNFTELEKPAQDHKVKFSIYYDFILRVLEANLPTTLFEKETIQKYKLDETLRKSQEVEFLQRIFRESENDIFLLNESLVKVRRHNNSITGGINKRAVADMLKVKRCLIKELPHNAPENVKNNLKYEYFKALYLAFKNKYSFIYFRGLLFSNKIINPLVYKLGILYIIHYFIDKGGLEYKKVIGRSLKWNFK